MRLLLLSLGAAAALAAADDFDFFESKIRPVLAARCYGCHSGKLKQAEGASVSILPNQLAKAAAAESPPSSPVSRKKACSSRSFKAPTKT